MDYGILKAREKARKKSSDGDRPTKQGDRTMGKRADWYYHRKG
jgi:hypothetical protein